MSSERPKVVFDCMVCLQAAAREESPAAACLRLAENRIIRLFLSRPILREIRDVLSRPEIQARFSELTEETVDSFVERLRKSSALIEPVPRRFDYPRDVDDEAYVNLAIEVEADFLVSRDKDLLDLMKWTTQDGREFQKRFRFVKILDPVEFLREISQRLQDSVS